MQNKGRLIYTLASILATILGVQSATGAVSVTLNLAAPSVNSTASLNGNTVSLSAPAPTGGAVVTLTSNSDTAVVPASITVAEGAMTSAPFSITTLLIGVNVTVNVTAKYDNSSNS